MTFHFAVTIDIPDTGENPQGSEDRKLAYKLAENEINIMLARGLRPLTTDTTWKVEAMRPGLEPGGIGRITEDGHVIMSTEQCALQKQCYKPDGHKPPCAKWGGELIITDPPLFVERYTRGGELDRPDQINIDARRQTIHERPDKTKYARCGQCLTRYEITDDPTENHHRAMRHKITCGKGDVDQYSEPQRAQLLEEFHRQPMQTAYRERAAAELAAGADPQRMKLIGVSPCPTCEGSHAEKDCPHVAQPVRWWQFWKWLS